MQEMIKTVYILHGKDGIVLMAFFYVPHPLSCRSISVVEEECFIRNAETSLELLLCLSESHKYTENA